MTSIKPNFSSFPAPSRPISTSTSSLPASPRKDKLHSLDIRDLCHYIAQYILQAIQTTTTSHPSYVPSAEYLPFEIKSSSNYPTIDQIKKLCQYLYNLCQLEYECLVSAFIYLQRMEKITQGNFRLTKSNWRISLLLCLMLSSKMLDDFSMENKDFSIAFDLVSLTQLNHLELLFLQLLDYQCCIPFVEYEQCYHDLITKKYIVEVRSGISALQSPRQTSSSSASSVSSSSSLSSKSSHYPLKPSESLRSAALLRKSSLEIHSTKTEKTTSQKLVSPQSITSPPFESPANSLTSSSSSSSPLLLTTLTTTTMKTTTSSSSSSSTASNTSTKPPPKMFLYPLELFSFSFRNNSLSEILFSCFERDDNEDEEIVNTERSD